MSLLLLVAGSYVLLYVAVLLPPVQDWICKTASRELSEKTGGRVSIGHVRIAPFNEVELYDVDVRDPHGAPVMRAEVVGGGISIGRLVFERRVVITFAEVSGLDARITQPAPDAPLNIQFLIDAFKSKEKKEPARFDLVLNNVILRDCSVSLDREWMPHRDDGRFDAGHIRVSGLSADLRLPVLRNDEVELDLRRLMFKESSGFAVDKISGRVRLTHDRLSVADLVIELPGTRIVPGDMAFALKGWESIDKQLLGQTLRLTLDGATVTPSDFACFLPALENYRQTVWLTVDAAYRGGDLHIGRLDILSQPGLSLVAKGDVSGLTGPVKEMRADFPVLRLAAQGKAINSIVTDFARLSGPVSDLVGRLGDVEIDASVSGSVSEARFKGYVSVAQGDADIDAEYRLRSDGGHFLRGGVSTSGFDLGSLIDNADFGKLAADVEAELTLRGKDISGSVRGEVPLFTYRSYPYSGISLDVAKHGDSVEGELHVDDPNLEFDIEGAAMLAGSASRLDVSADVRTLDLSAVNLATPYGDVSLTVSLDASLTGHSLADVEGYVDVSGLRLSTSRYQDVECDHIRIESRRGELPHSLTLASDYVDVDVTGEFDLQSLPASFKELVSHFLPDIVAPGVARAHSHQDFVFSVLLKKDAGLLERLKSPVTLFEDLELTGRYDSGKGVARLDMDIPYLRQGKDKLLRDTRLCLDVDTARDCCRLSLSTVVPNNKGDISLGLAAAASGGRLGADVCWDMGRARAYNGVVSLEAGFGKDEETGHDVIDMQVNRSRFEVNDTTWHIDPAHIRYSDKSLAIDGVRVHRAGQYVLIEGTATSLPEDSVRVSLRDIDLDYIFETLAIDYVKFGGRASGTFTASSVFTSSPDISTDDLVVSDMTYNRCVLGDARIKSHLDMARKSVYLDAAISEGRDRVARIYGDIFVVGDSLSLFCRADRVNVGFLQPFMAAFSSSVQGRASGDVHLYGTFKDIDLTGKVFADSLRMKVDVLNTYYTVRDSVTMTPGNIIIDNVTVRDREGHTARLSGRVMHEYFRSPRFDFAFTNARDFLVYDTNAAMNPVWYGTIYGSGTGSMHGVPGFIDIKVDMTTSPRSTFTFVLSDTEEAEAFGFLTFTDKRKAAREAAAQEREVSVDNRPWFVREFERKKAAQAARADVPTRYAMDIRVTATPSSDLTIVMDPVAGDKIRANGEGALRMSYNSEGEMDLYGTYTLSKGSYNFTMQDVIVRDFKIREGSKITFTGDPLAADLDIMAAYRVNTSLTDLDKSFADDRELNRTNVPVEALLKVSGHMQSPDIDFDIELPTLTEDVARKVKSIISTTDMMNRQIVYLLALNRFYTPDYMGISGSNNELASVASTTLSTQLSSMLGELTPGWSFSPYFRTDKGDFSDMEVDLALSSTLLDNRLILNGNLGYRDRATSSTTFIGDFDIEYLLNRSGTLRLKAYNHFNDQNYYLRSALTTQGVGIVFKRDFSRFLPGLFRRKKRKERPAIPPVKDVPAPRQEDETQVQIHQK